MLLKREKRSGRYHLRMQVPDDLRPLLGWEIKRSLMTTDLREAKRRYPAALEWAQARLDAARQQLRMQALEVDTEELEAAYEGSVTPEWRQLDYAIRHGGRGDPSLPEQDLTAEPEKWRRPFRWTPLAKLLKIEYPPSPNQLRPAAKPMERIADEGSTGATLGSIFEAWLAERRPPDRTRYEWQRAIDALASPARLLEGWDETPASAATRQALVAWKARSLGAREERQDDQEQDRRYPRPVQLRPGQRSGDGRPTRPRASRSQLDRTPRRDAYRTARLTRSSYLRRPDRNPRTSRASAGCLGSCCSQVRAWTKCVSSARKTSGRMP